MLMILFFLEYQSAFTFAFAFQTNMNQHPLQLWFTRQTLALQQVSVESACLILLSSFCDD